ncbi:MAG: phosphate ABC transporter substrate-binding/OmpA family protein [Sediminimonas sp.]|uniref:phosphate ABC transporter substrate-binding/OmpA family protein n=1 Tax=Sediminimonas sp. TaxID=2823379 RepID=UPI00286FE38C|nr:phosphate ABC transporter substrate-binding/OmpA family protein [Sediminimonas sp.]MDR9484752.1 phosphate ABC transporter substrate-binding/OmpA family protein [Sediminimonas sp.]
MKIARAAFVAALALFGMVAIAAAQDVRLSSRDGGIEITGTLLGYDGQFYRVETIYGELTVDGTGVLCDGPGCPSLEDFVAEIEISGAPTMGRLLLPALVQGFARRAGYALDQDGSQQDSVTYHLSDQQTGRKAARFKIRLSSSDEGFADLLVNQADIVMSRREVRDQEAARARATGLGDLQATGQSIVIALDALVPVVAEDNPLGAISVPDLARVFSGEIDNWSALGGPDAPITPHVGNSDAGASQAVVDLLLSPVRADLAPAAVTHASTQAVIEAIASDPFGIGLVSRATNGANGGTRQLDLSGSCGFVLKATRRSVKSEDYPLTAPMFLYRPMRRLPQVGREFMDYIQGPAAQLVIRRTGLIDLAAEEVGIEMQGIRLANAIAQAGEEIGLETLQDMIATLSPLKRLTTTFRYNAGSTRMDAQSRTNLSQLAKALEVGAYDGRHITLVGFTDGQGAPDVNRAMALRRAKRARQAIWDQAMTANPDRVTIDVQSFGEAMPMACDDSAWGRRINRRVEVWVR